MKFIGKTGADEGATCETRKFFRDNKFSQVNEIIVGTDRTGVRSLQLVLMHDKEHTEEEVLQYGYEQHSNDSRKYQFRLGTQLLEISSRIFFDSSRVMPERLISLDFFTNHCARTQQIFWTAEQNAEIENLEWKITEKDDKYIKAEIFGALIICYMLIITIIMCYCIFRNRMLILKTLSKRPTLG